jgi:PAS domain S-box-containing protein
MTPLQAPLDRVPVPGISSVALPGGETDDAYIGYDAGWRIVALNEAGRAWTVRTGHDPDEVLGRVVWDVYPALRGSPFQAAMTRAMRERVPVRFVMRGPSSDLWFETVGFPAGDGVGALSRDITGTRNAEMVHRLLAEAGRVLGDASLDKEATLAAITGLAVRELADWSFVDEADGDDGAFLRTAVAHADPAQAPIAARMRRRYPARPGARGVSEALATGRTIVMPHITAQEADALARDEDHRQVMRVLKLHSALVVPLVARGRVLGTLSLARGATAEPFGAGDVTVAQELAHRAAAALETARLYEAERLARGRADAVLESIEDGFASFDPEWRIRYVNQRAAELQGTTREELVGRELWGMMGALGDTPLTRAMRRVMETRHGEEVESFSRFLGGRWLNARVYPVEDGGISVIYRDVTERAELFSRERELRVAAERSAARTALLQRVTSLMAGALPTDAAAELFAEEVRLAFQADTCWVGVMSADGAEMRTLAVSGYPEGHLAAWTRFPLSAHTPAADVVRERRPRVYTDKAGLVRAYPLMGDTVAALEQEGVILVPMEIGEQGQGVVSLGFRARRWFEDEDVTFALALAGQCGQALERARLYEAERQARAEAEEANRAKAAFLATMSHELRTPLNAIGGYAELLEIGVYGGLTQAQADAVRRLQRSQRHLLSLIDDVLHFARLEAGHVELEIGEVDCDALLSGLESLVGPQLAARALAYAYTPAPLPLFARGDAEKLRQILLNLLANAIKFTPEGGRVEVWAEGANGAVLLRVRDTGTGILPEHLESVFDPFVQVGRTLSSPREGVGLGLAISRDLARAMGGDLLAESTPGQGSTFTVRVPRA